ncbi:hypothetical protein [Paenibacillus sp. HB172176]|uniref:hypothetical protein n=1 Tax=Paenibacillus sp. HB172176 TaxID=2493690 RepID=UPI001439F263|nr:hypothetical protein [Paenibacillus sp. HB172176]
MPEKKKARWPRANLSTAGITHIRWFSPYMIAWWSASFPGFGHFLLNQFFRGACLSISEVIFNSRANINQALMYTFTGQFELASQTVDPVFAFGYMLIYLISIWDSFRSALQHNRMFQLAELENARLKPFLITKMEVQYLEKKSPVKGALFSLAFPGMGQLYVHRIWLAFYGVFWWWMYISFSHVYSAYLELFHGNFSVSTQLLNVHWLLFMPSVFGGSIYHAFTTTIENNRLFRIEQQQYFTEKFGSNPLMLFPGGG